MSWKTDLQLRDLDPKQRMEFTCRRCSHVHFSTAEEWLQADEDAKYWHLDEVEANASCRRRGCRGTMQLSLVNLGRMTGFVGGIA